MKKILLTDWLHSYEMLIDQRCTSGEIKLKTKGDYLRLIAFCQENWGSKHLAEISVADVTSAIHTKAAVAPFAARRLRINMSDMFLEAQRAGVVRMGHNPALIAKKTHTHVSAQRLVLDEWLRIFTVARYRAPDYFQLAMLLALVTAQRSSDLVKMTRSDIQNQLLHVLQFKTGERIALPVNLRMEVIDTSIEDLLTIAPERGLLLQNRGRSVNTWNLSYWFRICRSQAGIKAINGTPPPFREQRSLSERLYRAQGVDTMTLLGHKYQKMTDQYNDIRGKEYRILHL
jgi:integrase